MAETHPRERAHRALREAGYSTGGDVKADKAQDAAMIRSALRQHENAEHGGKHEQIKLKRGGKVKGGACEARPDKRARGGHVTEPVEARARGGKTGGKSKGVTINLVTGKGDGGGDAMAAHQAGMQQGAALGARAAAAKMAGMGAGASPPGAGPMPGGPPPMAGPRPPMPPPGPGGPPGPLKRGGRVRRRADGGAMDADGDGGVV